jgi:hypothetical protein
MDLFSRENCIKGEMQPEGEILMSPTTFGVCALEREAQCGH